MPKMFSANPRVSRTDNSKISSSSNNKMITKSTRLSQLARSSRLSVNRTLANTFGPTDIFLSKYILPINVPIGTEIARISSKDVNSFTFAYSIFDNSLFYVEGDRLKTNTIFTDRTNFDGHSVRITSDDGLYKFSKTFFIPLQKPPVVSNIIESRVITFSTNSTQINLSNTFFDINGDILTITAIPDDPEVVSTNINGYMLTLTINKSGTTPIKVTAYDSYNEFVTTIFIVLVLPENAGFNIIINELPSSLPEPVNILINEKLTSFTLLDDTYVQFSITETDNITEEDKRYTVKLNISSIINKYITTSQDNTNVDLYIPINVLPFPQLAYNIDKVRIVDGSTSTSENPLSVTLTDNLENSAMYINTVVGNVINVNLSSDTLTLEQVTENTFNVSINGGAIENKNSGDFVVMPTSETVILLGSILIAENHAPIAYNVNYTFSEDSIQNIIELNGYDIDINETSTNYIQYVIETSPQYGVLDVLTNTDLTNKQIKYTPSANYFGYDTFSYYVKDNYGVVSNTANASITVISVNDNPVFTSTPITDTNEDSVYTYNITITDEDGHNSVITAPTKPNWLTLTDNSDNTAILTGTPLHGDVGINDVVITATDPSNGVTKQSFNISVANVNDNPVFTSTPITTTNEDSVYTYNITITDEDGHNSVITAPTKPNWLTLTDNSDNTAILTGTPLHGDVGINDVVITATDPSNGVTKQSFNISVANVNDNPVFTSTPITTTNEDSVYTYNITITDEDGHNSVITAPTKPNWLTLTDNSDNTAILTGTPLQGDVGINDVVITATDPSNGVTNQSFTISVSNVNDQPTGQLEISGIVMESITISANTTNITDEDGVLTYTYQWELSNDNSTWTNITDETNQSYTIQKDQGYIGKYVRVTAQSTDPNNNQSSHTSASSVILEFNDPPTNIQLSGNEVYEAYEIGQEIGTLTSSDTDSTSFTYEVDSNLFAINNDKLLSNHVFSYGSNNTYTINITTIDETLNAFTKSFVITVKKLWVYTTLSSTEVAIGNNTTDLANGTVLGTNLTGSIIIPSTIEDINGNTYDVTNIYQNAFTGSSLEKITFSGDTTYTLDIPLKQNFQVIQTEEEYVLHQLNEI